MKIHAWRSGCILKGADDLPIFNEGSYAYDPSKKEPAGTYAGMALQGHPSRPWEALGLCLYDVERDALPKEDYDAKLNEKYAIAYGKWAFHHPATAMALFETSNSYSTFMFSWPRRSTGGPAPRKSLN